MPPDARLANQCRYAYYLEHNLSDLLSVNSDEVHSIVVETSVKELLLTLLVGLQSPLCCYTQGINLANCIHRFAVVLPPTLLPYEQQLPPTLLPYEQQLPLIIYSVKKLIQ